MNTITRILGNHHCLKHNPTIVYVNGEIDDDVLEAFRADFSKAVARNQTIIPVVIHSTGGDVCDALAMMALMKSSPVTVATIVPSHAYSAAALLSSAGTKGYRYLGPNATLMMHDASVEELSGNARAVAHEAGELKRINSMMFRLLGDNCGQTADFFANKVRTCDGDDLYINATTSKRWKLADHIALPTLQTTIRIESELISGDGGGVDPSTRFLLHVESSESGSDSDEDEPVKKRRRKNTKRKHKESVTELLSRILRKEDDEDE